MSLFIAQSGAVWMLGGKPWRMSEEAVDSFLDTFQREGEWDRFNALYEAAQKAYGASFIPRVNCIRLVSDNSPQDVVRQMLAASVEDLLAAQALEQQP